MLTLRNFPIVFFTKELVSQLPVFIRNRRCWDTHAGKDTFFCSLKGRKVQRYTNQSMTGVEACFLIKNF